MATTVTYLSTDVAGSTQTFIVKAPVYVWKPPTFKREPIRLPHRRRPCACGSGKRYKNCCWLRDSRKGGAK